MGAHWLTQVLAYLSDPGYLENDLVQRVDTVLCVICGMAIGDEKYIMKYAWFERHLQINLLIYQARESSLVPAGFLTAQFLHNL